MMRMNREEYIQELTQCLRHASELEKEEAIRYCEEYLDEAGAENMEQAIQDLGKPAKFAAQIKAEAAIRSNVQAYDKKEKNTFHNIWMIFLGIFALPLALPFMLTAVLLMFTFFLVIVILIIAGFLVAGACVIASIVFLISFFILPFGANSLLRLGGGCLLLGVGLLLTIGMYYAIHAVVPWFTKIATNLYQKAKGGNRHEI